MTPVERDRREKLRLRAAGWFAEGVSQAEVARRSGVSPQAVSVWHRAWVDGGVDALRSAGPPGTRRRLSDEGFAEVAAVLEAGPEASGFTGQIWTLARVGRVITQVTGVVYASPSSVWRLLRAHGWSRQRPARRAWERDEEAVTTWRSTVWPQAKPPRSEQVR
ncbi:winged helix-turn-helix domain-containing protein [Embleya sp. NPDC050493]|uniref:winged helix-turn-helix domain-containing protein n=1 Tax=Embleya sp. NPDC050493 TaxID=3363989 RepID=UPI0037B06689